VKEGERESERGWEREKKRKRQNYSKMAMFIVIILFTTTVTSLLFGAHQTRRYERIGSAVFNVVNDKESSRPSPPVLKKQRIDEIMVFRSLAQDVAEAKALVMSGSVLLEDGEIVTSSAMKIKTDREIRLKLRKTEPYVSRAGRKLAHAISVFNLSSFIEDSVCIDIGCSTGGFSDVLLQNNCSVVYAVDVGVSLLDWKVRNHPKVIVVEKQNARYLNSSVVAHAGKVGVIVCDVSFISLRMVLPPSLDMW
jgi:TlyA family rRNA methyltransferase/putative hemolysin